MAAALQPPEPSQAVLTHSSPPPPLGEKALS
jgi:hypothetical protein